MASAIGQRESDVSAGTVHTQGGGGRFFKGAMLIAAVLLLLASGALAARFALQARELSQQLEELREQLEAALLAAGEAAGAEPSEPPAGTEPPAVPGPEVPDYTELYPELYADTEGRGTEDTDNRAYLTFDDGPSPRTDEILKILDQYGVKATFFVVGASGEDDLQRMRDIVAAGHTLAIHSYSHNYQKIYASVEAYLEDFNQMYTQIVEATGVRPQIFRFPGGSINAYNGGIYQEIIAEMTRRGFVYFDWNAANGDAVSSEILPAATLAGNALKGVGSKRRAVILMHDSGSKTTTVEALPAIIEGYQKGGYTFAPLSAAVKPVTFGYRY